MMRTKWGSLILGVVPFLSHGVLYVQKATDTINKKGLEGSYMVSYRVARTGKPHTIVEDLILPAAADMAGTMLG